MSFSDESVTMKDVTTGGTPYRFLNKPDLRRMDSSQSPFESTTSTVEVTAGGRVVYRPKPKKVEA